MLKKFFSLCMQYDKLRNPVIRYLCRNYPEHALMHLKDAHKNSATCVEKCQLDCLDTSSLEASLRILAKPGNTKEIPQSLLEAIQQTTGLAMGYSQEGEDLLLSRLLKTGNSGLYIDIGAHHPIRFSNTYRLYRSGWRGLNIDATPGSMEAFRILRPLDINIESAVSDVAEPAQFYMFEEGALNTFDSILAEKRMRLGWKLSGMVEIHPKPLYELIDTYIPKCGQIDLMNIDVEGNEFGVLRSNDWNRFRPKLILLEILETPMSQLHEHQAVKFLKVLCYEPVARLLNTVILQSND